MIVIFETVENSTSFVSVCVKGGNGNERSLVLLNVFGPSRQFMSLVTSRILLPPVHCNEMVIVRQDQAVGI